MEKKLGKIKNVSFGLGGYQGMMLGIHIELGGESWRVMYNKNAWDAENIKVSEYSKWTEEDRSKQYDYIMRYVSSLIYKAKVHTVDQLKDKPIEATFNGNTLVEWRILEEVL